MSDRTHRAAEIQRHINDVLLDCWDPLSVRAEEGHADEYNAYVGPVYRLLASGASALAIAEHLARVEADAMGFERTDPQALLPVADALLRLDIRL